MKKQMKQNKRKLYVWVPGLLVALVYVAKVVANCLVLFGKQNTDELFKAYLNSSTPQVDTGIAVISIAISVWIGLNIYTYIEKTDLDRLSQNTATLRARMNSFAKQQKLDFLKELRELRKTSDGTITILHEIFLAEFVEKENKYTSFKKREEYTEEDTYETVIYEMLYALKAYAQAYNMDRLEGRISEDLEIALEQSIYNLSNLSKYKLYKLGAVYNYFIHFLKGEYLYFSKQYPKAKLKFEQSLKILENNSNSQEKLDTNNLTMEQVKIIMNGSIGWTTYCCGPKWNPKYLEKALSYYEALPENDEERGVIYDQTFLSRYYRNRGVLLEKKGKLDEAKESYKVASSHQSALDFDVKTAYVYPSVIMKIWDRDTQKSSVNEWFQGKEQTELVKKEYGDAEVQLMLAKNNKPGDAGIYIQYAKLLTYKALIMKSEKSSFFDIKKITDEAFLNIKIAEQLSPGKGKSGNIAIKYIERDLYCALYISSDEENTSEDYSRRIIEQFPDLDGKDGTTKDYLRVAVAIMDKFDMKNAEAMKMREQIGKILNL